MIGYIFISIIFLALVWMVYKMLFKKQPKASHRWRKESASKTLQKVRAFANDGQVISYLRNIDHFVFEELLLLAVEQNLNCKSIHNDKYTGDGGVDGRFIHFTNDGKKRLYLIQAKKYKAHINHQDILKLSEQVRQEKAYKGLFIHTGKSGKQSWKNSFNVSNVEIVSGRKLVELIRFGF